MRVLGCIFMYVKMLCRESKFVLIKTHKSKFSIMEFKQIKVIVNAIFHIAPPFLRYLDYSISELHSNRNTFLYHEGIGFALDEFIDL